MRYELTDHEWAAIRPMLPNKGRRAPHVDDRRILTDICWVLRSGAPWRDMAFAQTMTRQTDRRSLASFNYADSPILASALGFLAS